MSDFGAFVPGPRLRLDATRSGALDGLSFAIKDLFDVAGQVTGCGNPDWADTHPVATDSAWAVRGLLDAGAKATGKTVTDEISLGLLGSNRFFGAPINPIAPDRYPGGSSSGSTVAVAAGVVDFALGSDTGGSVRMPSSFLGLYGLRPTHGSIPVAGLMTQAPSFDTVGFFARNAKIFQKVGAALLPEAPVEPITTVLIAEDALACCDPDVRSAASIAIEGVVKHYPDRLPILILIDAPLSS
jgi:amidase